MSTEMPNPEETQVTPPSSASESNTSEEETSPSNEDPSFMDKVRLFWKNAGEKKQKTLQIIFGIALGVICSLFLFLNFGDDTESKKTFISWPLILAFTAAIVVPNMLEYQLSAKLPKMKLTLAITIAAGLLVYVLYLVIAKPA